MRYRLPLELELAILELAAPPLAIDSLHDRVAFFITTSLVHRSLTAWAQERLHDQFLYTYRPRNGEYARLERRLTEGGYGASCSIQRLYLDVTRLRRPGDPEPDNSDAEENPDSAGAAETPASASESSPTSEGQSDNTSNGHGIFQDRRGIPDPKWRLSPLLSRCVQALDTLWLMQPFACLDLSDIPAPRLLESDDHAFGMEWNQLRALPLLHRTTLVLRNTLLVWGVRSDSYPVLNLILDRCRAYSVAELLSGFPDLEVFVACESSVVDSLPQLDWLPSSLRHIHILQRNFKDLQEHLAEPATFTTLESLTFTWLQPVSGESGSIPAEVTDPLPDLRQHVESTVVAPQCTFKYLRSTKAPKDALADAVAELGLDL